MTQSKTDSAAAASRDPFSQLEFKAAKAQGRELEKQIRKSLQIDLGFSDARAPEAEEPTPTPAEDAAWACSLCSCKDAQRVFKEAHWRWACDTCGNQLTPLEVEKVAPRMKAKNWARLPPPPTRHRMVKVFDHEQLQKIAENRETLVGDYGDLQRIKGTLTKLLQLDDSRPLALPGLAYEAELEELAIAFPAFARVISETVAPSLAVLAAGGFVRPAPLLLVGAPGIGKTFFLSSLARTIGVPMVKQDMSSATTGCSLSGLGVHWSNSSPGSVFRALAFGKPGSPAVANPLFLLDELDKCSGDRRFDPLGPLHALLEEESAAHFEDESLPGVVFNASEIRWVATSNSVRGIPAPILSRMHVIEIEDPTQAERVALAERIFSGVVRSMRLREFVDVMPDGMLDRAADLPPREFKRLAQMAVGRAIARGDFQPQTQDFEVRATAQKRRMGF